MIDRERMLGVERETFARSLAMFAPVSAHA
jgi:hypothetical protein